MSENPPEVEFHSTLDQTYSFTPYKYETPKASNKTKASATYSGTDKKIYDQNMCVLTNIQNYPKIPTPADFKSLEEYKHSLNQWVEASKRFVYKTAFPVPISHAFSRPMPPQIYSKEDLADSVMKRKLMRGYNPEISRLTPDNELCLQKLMHSGENYSLDDVFPNKAINESDITFNLHLVDELPWSAELIPERPSPYLFPSFADYEAAMMRWSEIVTQSVKNIPPNPEQIGEMISLLRESNDTLAPPPPPSNIFNRIFSINTIEIESPKKLGEQLQKLKVSYCDFIKSPQANNNKIASNFRSYAPSHWKFSNASKVINQLAQFGVPWSAPKPFFNLEFSKSLFLRQERSFLDFGYLASPIFVNHGQYRLTKHKNEILTILQNDVKKFLFLDLNLRDFSKVISEKLASGQYVVEFIAEKTNLIDLINLSTYSLSPRYTMRFTILFQNIIQIPKIQDQIIELDLSYLEKFVDIFTCSAINSFPLEILQEDEMLAACIHDPQQEQNFDQFYSDFRQAQLVHCLSSIVFSSSSKFYSCLPFVRKLIHTSCFSIQTIVTNDAQFNKILEGFQNENQLIHNFFYRLLRTSIILQYAKIIRILGGHDLISFFQTSLCSQWIHVKRDAYSLLQLFLHSDTSFALQLQFLQTSSYSIYSMIQKMAQPIRKIVLSFFSLYRIHYSSFDYRPLPFAQFQGLFELATKDLQLEPNVDFLSDLLSMALTDECIYSTNVGDVSNLMNQFASSSALSLTTNCTCGKMNILKKLYKFQNLEYDSYANPVIWDFIFNQMSMKTDNENDHDNLFKYKMTSWKAFKNAVLTQNRFVNYIISNPDLCKKLDACFGSFDTDTIRCMVVVLQQFSNLMIIENESSLCLDNLNELFAHLSEDTVMIAGRLLSASKMSYDTTLCGLRASLTNFFVDILKSKSGSALYNFRKSPQISSTLDEVLMSVAKIHLIFAE